MSIVNNFIVIIFSVFSILSCTPSAPYEIRSPCVTIDPEDDNIHIILPCTRKPANSTYQIV